MKMYGFPQKESRICFKNIRKCKIHTSCNTKVRVEAKLQVLAFLISAIDGGSEGVVTVS